MSLVTARLVDTIDATPRSRLLIVDLTGRPFDFRAGQAVTAGLHGSAVRWPYSIACSPEYTRQSGHLQLLVSVEQRDRPDYPSHASRGALLDLEGPLGTFTFPERPRQSHLLFVAGGIGIAPLRAMLDHVLRSTRTYRITVLYSARRATEFAFIDELRAYERKGRIELFQTVTRDDSGNWSGERGRIGRAHLEAAVEAPTSTLCFVCGPQAFVTEATAALRALGVPTRQIRSEQWRKEPDSNPVS